MKKRIIKISVLTVLIVLLVSITSFAGTYLELKQNDYNRDDSYGLSSLNGGSKSTVASSGCGVVSSAMVIANLGEVSQDIINADRAYFVYTIADEFLQNGWRAYGKGTAYAAFTNTNYWAKYGIEAKGYIGYDQTLKYIQEGCMCIFDIQDNNKRGHYLAIGPSDRADRLTSEGWVKILDPATYVEGDAAYIKLGIGDTGALTSAFNGNAKKPTGTMFAFSGKLRSGFDVSIDIEQYQNIKNQNPNDYELYTQKPMSDEYVTSNTRLTIGDYPQMITFNYRGNLSIKRWEVLDAMANQFVKINSSDRTMQMFVYNTSTGYSYYGGTSTEPTLTVKIQFNNGYYMQKVITFNKFGITNPVSGGTYTLDALTKKLTINVSNPNSYNNVYDVQLANVDTNSKVYANNNVYINNGKGVINISDFGMGNKTYRLAIKPLFASTYSTVTFNVEYRVVEEKKVTVTGNSSKAQIGLGNRRLYGNYTVSIYNSNNELVYIEANLPFKEGEKVIYFKNGTIHSGQTYKVLIFSFEGGKATKYGDAIFNAG